MSSVNAGVGAGVMDAWSTLRGGMGGRWSRGAPSVVLWSAASALWMGGGGQFGLLAEYRAE